MRLFNWPSIFGDPTDVHAVGTTLAGWRSIPGTSAQIARCARRSIAFRNNRLYLVSVGSEDSGRERRGRARDGPTTVICIGAVAEDEGSVTLNRLSRQNDPYSTNKLDEAAIVGKHSGDSSCMTYSPNPPNVYKTPSITLPKIHLGGIS